MENFAFYNPVKILFGKGQIANFVALGENLDVTPQVVEKVLTLCA